MPRLRLNGKLSTKIVFSSIFDKTETPFSFFLKLLNQDLKIILTKVTMVKEEKNIFLLLLFFHIFHVQRLFDAYQLNCE